MAFDATNCRDVNVKRSAGDAMSSHKNWVNEGGLPNAQLAIALNQDGRLELFAVNGTELDHIWQTAPNAAWSAWAKLGGGGCRIAAGANADGRIELFASSDAGVFHCWQEVFAFSSSGVFHKWQTGFNSWSDWGWLNSTAGPSPA
ncbi:hypothetical protein ABH926_003365 [Catenulispora sp. GP43]|uniref:hypothetical protein n=1 Tax=Catenulispora sp. GP43 TaxID=3156263 RepID=UPI0035166DF0